MGRKKFQQTLAIVLSVILIISIFPFTIFADITDETKNITNITNIPGDVDGDGTVTLTDVVCLAQIVAKWQVSCDESALDTDGDSSVTLNDVVRLAQFIAKWDVKIEHIHNIELHKRKEPTCTQNGNIEYYSCFGCNKCYSDSKCINEISIAETLLFTNKHSSLNHVNTITPTCTKSGVEEHWYCTTCNKYFKDASATTEITYADTIKSATDHTEVIDEAKEAKPGQTGLTEGSHCSVCGEIIVAQKVIDALPINYHSITYKNLNGAESPTITQYAEHEGVPSLPELSVKGYEFVGWYTAPNGQGEYISSIEAGSTKNYTLHAYWKINTYTIYFHDAPENVNATSTHNTTKYTVEDRIVLEEPKWSGLKFVNWTDATGQVVTEIPKGTAGDIDLTANWKVERNLAKAYDDTKNVTPFYYDPIEKTYYFVYKIGTLEHVVLDEFVLGKNLKYNTQATDLTFSLTDTVTVENSTTTTIGHTVSESVSSSTEWSNAETYTQSSSNEEHFDVTVGIEIGKDTWPVRGKLETTYGNSHTTTNEYSNTYVEGGSDQIGSEEVKESSIGISYMEQITSSVTKEISISADKPKGYYSYVHAANVNVFGIVAFNATTGNYALTTYSFVDNMHEMTLYYPTLESLENPTVETLPYNVPVEKIVEYIDKYNYVNYDGNGGSYNYTDSDIEGIINGMPMSNFAIEESNTLPKNLYTKTGYTFEGWSLTKNGEVVYKDEDRIPTLNPGEVLTLYAVWSKNKYTIQYNANKPANASNTVKDMPNDLSCIYDTDITLGTAPMLTGWKFDGWYGEPDCIDKIGDATEIKNNLTSKPNDIITLYAKWTATTCSISYNANGGNVTTNTSHTTKLYDSLYGELPVPTRKNCEFLGWYNGETKISSTTKLNTLDNVELIAHWKPSTTGTWNSGSRDKKITTDGWSEYWDTGLNREALKEAGYTQVEISFKINGHFLSGDWFKADWYMDFYDRWGSKIYEDMHSPWEKSWSSRTYTYTFSIDAIRDDGTILVRYDHEGDGQDDWGLGTVELNTTAK